MNRSKSEMKTEKIRISTLDMQIIIAVGICCLTSTVLNYLGIKFPWRDMRLEIIQKITASISCLLCTQDKLPDSAKSGKIRILVTIMAGISALIVVGIDSLIGNDWISILLVMLGVLLTLFLCKAIKVPYINCRIGAINFILICCTFSGETRFIYGVFRIISTIYGILIVLLVSWIYSMFKKKFEKEENYVR